MKRSLEMTARPSAKDLAEQEVGFTIVELMIATLVFSVILVVIMVGVVSFTNSYFKGINSSTTQTTTRTALDTISQAIEFSGGTVTHLTASATQGTYCVGSVQYDYNLGVEQTGTALPALYQTPRNSASLCMASGFMANQSQELLGKNMRLSVFTVTPDTGGVGQIFTVELRVAYGDDSLLYSPAGLTPLGTAKDITCRSDAGSQFCSVVDLSSSVQKRVQ